MNQNLITPLLLVFFSIALSGCKSKEQKIQEYVMGYNKVAVNLKRDIIKSTSATILHGDTIKIVTVVNMETDEDENKAFDQWMVGSLQSYFRQDKVTRQVVNEGAVLLLVYMAKDNTELLKIVIDKKTIDKPIDDEPKTNAERNEHDYENNPNVSDYLKTLLRAMNKTLPIEDTASGTKIIKIDTDNQLNMLYSVVVNEDTRKLFDDENHKNVVKENIINSIDMRQLIKGVKQSGFNNIHYVYMDTRGNILADIEFTEKDLE